MMELRTGMRMRGVLETAHRLYEKDQDKYGVQVIWDCLEGLDKKELYIAMELASYYDEGHFRRSAIGAIRMILE